VHCLKGMGRSAIFVIAYLMMKKSMSLEEALNLVAKSRYVSINENFLQQLIDLESELKK
jgi:protein-tyrosine phosphatase